MQRKGFLESVVRLMRVGLQLPDYKTVSPRPAGADVAPQPKPTQRGRLRRWSCRRPVQDCARFDVEVAMAGRKSIYIDSLGHQNPIPAGCRVGKLLMSGIVGGVDPATRKLAPTLDEQCALMFSHVRDIVEGGGGTLADIVKITVYLKDHADREALNREWLKAFPDPDDRPARQAMPGTPNARRLIECDFVAVVGG